MSINHIWTGTRLLSSFHSYSPSLLPYNHCSSYITLNSYSSGPVQLSSPCNHACNCTGVNYVPVCGGPLTYFSPCHAGCSEGNNMNKVWNSFKSSSWGAIALYKFNVFCPVRCYLIILFCFLSGHHFVLQLLLRHWNWQTVRRSEERHMRCWLRAQLRTLFEHSCFISVFNVSEWHSSDHSDLAVSVTQ